MAEKLSLYEVERLIELMLNANMKDTKLYEKFLSIQYVMKDMPEGSRYIYIRIMNWL